jgi:hypothetical protein
MGTIDDILNDEPATEQPAAEVVETPAVEPEAPVIEAEPGPVRDEKGRFAPKGENESASPAPVEDNKAGFDPAPVIAERRRRQEAEQRAATLEAQLAQLQNPPAPPPSIWDDEQGAFQHFGQQVVSHAVGDAVVQSRLHTSELLASQAFPDFEQVWEPMNQFLTENPAIIQKARSDRHPWAYAYRAYKNATTMQELGATDMDALKAKLREELQAELAAQQPQTPTAPAIPMTLSNERNVGQRSGPAWSGPRPLNELLS